MYTALVTALFISGCKAPAESPFLLEAADLGEPRAASSGYALAGGDAAWRAAAQILPGQLWDDPGYELPLAIWDEILTDPSIADEGSCPYVVADGPTLTWMSDCRSQDGYDWTGSMSRTDGEDESGRSTTLWEMELSVTSDTTYPRFTQVGMWGSVLITDSGGELQRGVQTNLTTTVEDFEDVAQGDDTQKTIWSIGWTLSGRHEEHTDGTLVLSGSTTLGELGGLAYDGTALSSDNKCPGEPDGVLTLSADGVAELSMNGVSGVCDSCADLTLDGMDMGEVCLN